MDGLKRPLESKKKHGVEAGTIDDDDDYDDHV